MPELAEVAYASTRWKAGINLRIQEVTVHPKSRVFREHDRSSFIEGLSGSILRSSQTHGKQMLFGFSGNRWLGLHLGMTGWLHSEPTSYSPAKHDAIVLPNPSKSSSFGILGNLAAYAFILEKNYLPGGPNNPHLCSIHPSIKRF